VDVVLRDETIEIRVEDAGDCYDLERVLSSSLPAATATGGRGLRIVRALADTLTVEHAPRHSCRVTAILKI
jgi:anti-sigma regulatory factor (Ser/Thr protein kinase)